MHWCSLQAAEPVALKGSGCRLWGDNMREYIARDPKTGKPLRTGRKRRQGLELAYKPGEGAWDAIPLDRILPLATGVIEVEPVRWREKERLLRQHDAIRALPRIRGRDLQESHNALDSACLLYTSDAADE